MCNITCNELQSLVKSKVVATCLKKVICQKETSRGWKHGRETNIHCHKNDAFHLKIISNCNNPVGSSK